MLERRLVHYKDLSTTDLSFVKDLYLESFPEAELIPWAEMETMFDQDYAHLFVFYNEDEPVAFVSGLVSKSHFYVNYLAVSNQHQSKGYGSLILKLVDDYFPGRDLVLEIEPLDQDSNNYSQRVKRWQFYQRNGFKTSPYQTRMNGLNLDLIIKGEADIHADEIYQLINQQSQALDEIPIIEK